jgi:hypothetical protein
MSVIKELRQPILTNPFLSAERRYLLGKLLDSIDADLDANEYSVEDSVTGDILKEYNQCIIDETPEEDTVIAKNEDGDEVEISREEMLDDFQKAEESDDDDDGAVSKDELLEDLDDTDKSNK